MILLSHLISRASMLIVSILTIARIFHIRSEVMKYLLTLPFTLNQVFIHFLKTNIVQIHTLALLKFILPSFSNPIIFFCNKMVIQIVSGHVFFVCFLSVFVSVFAEYNDFVKGFLISPGYMLIVSILTVVGAFHIRNKLIKYALTLAFALHQIFIHFFLETNIIWIYTVTLLKFILSLFSDSCNQIVTQIVSGRVFLVCFLLALLEFWLSIMIFLSVFSFHQRPCLL